MLLKLSFSENRHAPVNAAFVSGGSAYDWLAEIGNWNVDIHAIRCFVLPESISANRAGGVLVIFLHESVAAKLTLRSPYTQVAPGFYIPVHAVLTPAVTVAELTSIKLWDIQVFHPSIGLTGFEQQDELLLNELIEMPPEGTNDWLPAYPPIQPFPRLNSIRLEPDETPFDPGALIQQLPLGEIPGADKQQQEPLKRILRLLGKTGLWLLLILAAIGKIIFAVLRAFFGRQTGRTVSSRKKDLLGRLEDWVNKKLKDIEKQRDSELNRLLKLFDKNNDEALHYAIPLNSPYLNRGTAAKSGKLTRRSLNLNLRSFGRGGRADYWDLGEYRNTLRQQYIKTLNAAIEKGDYKKAAYIYAHLLGDLPMAAQTLQNGKHYREAAALYKDHLNNKSKAAECLEKGGLIYEAIPIYADLGNYEKAGDLHVLLGQEHHATKYYNDTVKRSLDAKDYLNAARLKIDKMGNIAEAQTILLNGWKDNNQPEQCLAKYFEAIPAAVLHNSIKNVYDQHTTLRQKTAFLKVVADLLQKNEDGQLRETALAISYEVVHQQVKRGDNSGLKLLNKFIPGDHLLAQDASRYMLQNHQKVPLVSATSCIQLRQDTNWVTLINYHDQLIGAGFKNQEVHLFRANWDGKVAYEFLFLFTGLNAFLRLTADAQVSSQVLLTGNVIPLGAHKKMPSFSYFENELDLFQMNWQLPNTLGYCLLPNADSVFILHVDGDHLCIDEFSHEGSLLQKTYCYLQDIMVSISDMPFLRYCELYWREEHFYFVAQDRLIRLDAKGKMEMLPINADVFAFYVSAPHATLKIAVITSNGCLIVSPDFKGMKITMHILADELLPCFVQLLPDNLLILGSEEVVFVYDISGSAAKLVGEVHPENPVRKIFSVPKRHHFALLEGDGKISIHNVAEQW